MEMKKNEKGSSLIFAVVVIMVLSIVIAAALAISYTYYNRSIANNSKRQAYLTAKSVLTNVVDNINTTDYSALIPTEIGSAEYDISDFPTELGEVDKLSFLKNLEKDENQKDIEKITISVSATYGGKQATMNADLKRYEKENWQLIKYYDGEIINDTNITKAKTVEEKVKAIMDALTNGGQKEAMDLVNNTATEIPGYELPLDNSGKIKNDFLQKYYYYYLCDGEFPMLNNDELNIPDSMKYKDNKEIHYYIRVMFGVGINKNYTVIYATKQNDIEDNNNWKPDLVYYEGHWYYAENKWNTFNFPGMAGLDQKDDESKEAVYKSIIDSCTSANLAQ